jgi:hypothetical protein
MRVLSRSNGPIGAGEPHTVSPVTKGGRTQKTTEHSQPGFLASLRQLSDAELVARLKSLASRERRATVLLVAHLAELDTRDVYLREGYSSLLAYCRDALCLSEHEAYNRIEVAPTARRFPVVLELLATGSANLTTVRLLGPHLRPENHREVLESARGERKTEVEEIVAGLSPLLEVPASAPRLPGPKPAPQHLTRSANPSSAGTLEAAEQTAPVAPAAVVLAPAAEPPEAVRPEPFAARQACSSDIAPLSPGRYKLQLTISGSTLEKLRVAKDMLRHAIPSGDEAAVLDRALTLLLEGLARKKFAAAESPRPSRATVPGSRHIPAGVKRAVWVRDLGRCAFVATNGRRCGARGFVEFHHVRPHAVGGEASVENVQLRCPRHNDYEVRACFGQGRGGSSGSQLTIPDSFQNDLRLRMVGSGGSHHRPGRPHAWPTPRPPVSRCSGAPPRCR